MNYRRILTIVVLTLLMLVGVAGAVSADGDIHYVAPSGSDTSDCTNSAFPCATVQYAVDQAGAGDEVRVAVGTYIGVNDRGGLSQIAYISKTVTVRGGFTTSNWAVSDPESNPTTLDAQGNGRVLYITGQVTPTIEGLWITGGDATGLGGGPSGADAGGGVYINSATVVISHCMITSNAVSKSVGVFRVYGYGGGVYQTGGEVLLLDNTISHNTVSITNTTSGAGYPYALHSYAYGGGVYQRSGQISLVGNTILSNTASAFALSTYQYHYARKPYAYAYGGGLYLEGNAILVNNLVSANDVSAVASLPNHDTTNAYAYGYGGGVWAGSNVTIMNNTITSNTLFFSTDIARTGGDGRGYGGGVYLDSDDVTLVGNSVSRNTIQGSGRTPRGFGGGVSGNGGSTIAHNHVSSNTISCLSTIVNYGARAYVYGGGMYFGGSGVVLAHNTVEANLVYANSTGSYEYAYAGGIYLGDSGTLNGNVILSNTASALYVGNGGGVWANNDVTFTNNVIVANKADDDGDGVYVNGDSVFLYNTIVNNDGDGVYVDGASYLTNTIIAGHLVGVAGTSASTVTLDHTLLYSNTVDWSGPGSLWHTDSIYGDPVFASDGYHLTASSAAIDQGIDVGVTDDVDGHPRPLGSGHDIGADEFGIVLTITKSAPIVVVGTPLTYTLAVSNVGQKVATGVVVTDAVPTGASYLSGGVESNGVITWSGLTIDAGSVATATFTVTTCQTNLTNERYRAITSTEGVTTSWGASLVTDLAPPTIDVDLYLSPTTVFSGGMVDFVAASSTDGSPIVGWQWDFGDGDTSSGRAVTHTYTAASAYTVTLLVTDTCGYAATTSHTVYVTSTPFVPIYGVNLTPPSMAVSGDPGDDVTYTLWLTNTGNVADTFDLTLGGNVWATVVDPAMVNLQPSEMRDVTVTVSTAGTAQHGDTDVVTVTATSQISPTMMDSSVLTTSVNVAPCTELTGVAIAGVSEGYPGIYTFTTNYEPVSATIPITYLWDNGDTVSTTVRTLDVGAHTLVVTATNCGGAQAVNTHTITISASPVCIGITDVGIAGEETGHVGNDYTFSAQITPSNATPLVSYTWSPAPTHGQDTSAATYEWGVTGTHSITVAATNCDGMVNDIHSISIEPMRIYLPLMLRNYSGPLTRHELEDAPDTCPGHSVQVGNHLYLDDFDTLNDHDWYSFEAIAGQTYTIQTSELELRADTSIALYANDCTTILAESDDIAWPDDVASRIVWTAQSDGTYHVDVRSYDWQVHGNDTGYTFGVRLGAAADMNPALESMPGVPVKPLAPTRP